MHSNVRADAEVRFKYSDANPSKFRAIGAAVPVS